MNIASEGNRNDIIKFLLDMFFELDKKIILPSFNNLKASEIEVKSESNDFVTIADKKAEEFIVSKLEKKFYRCQFICEERGFINSNKKIFSKDNYIWTIDPIDGTRNYINGNTNFCTMVSLIRNKETILSFIFYPMKNILIYSFKGFGVFQLNLKSLFKTKLKIKTNNSNVIGSINTKGMTRSQKKRSVEIIQKNIKRVFIGSIGLEIFYMVKNKINFILYGRITPWDHSPLDLIIREAGGQVFMCNKKKIFKINSKGPILSASNLFLWNKIRNLIFSN